MSAQAKRVYEGYATSTGGKTFDGRQMPAWEELPDRIQETWRAAIAAALDEPASATETLTDVQVRLLDEVGTKKIADVIKTMMPPDSSIRMLREWLRSKGAR